MPRQHQGGDHEYGGADFSYSGPSTPTSGGDGPPGGYIGHERNKTHPSGGPGRSGGTNNTFGNDDTNDGAPNDEPKTEPKPAPPPEPAPEPATPARGPAELPKAKQTRSAADKYVNYALRTYMYSTGPSSILGINNRPRLFAPAPSFVLKRNKRRLGE